MRTINLGRLTVGAGLVALILVGCGFGGGGMPMKPEPEPEPLPTLVGTWRSAVENTWIDSDTGQMMSSSTMLTFIGDRAIAIVSVYADGVHSWYGFHASGWEATETAVTRHWFWDRTDDDQDNPTHGRVEKAYSWGDDERRVLVMEKWSAFDPETETERWQRVPVDTLPSPVGSWRYERDDDDLYELTIGLDRTFELVRTRPHEVQTITGTGTLDLENYFVHLADLHEVETDGEGNVIEEGPYRGGSGRAAFVPYDRGIALSPPWDDLDDDIPYGVYSLFFEPAQ